MIKNSIRQLFRTKVKSTLFFVLISVCALLICLGCNLVNQCQANMEKFKSVFTTIGTVEQLPVAYGRQERYDAEMETYTYSTTREYGEVFDLNELNDLEGVTYISGPEHRAWYSACMPGYRMMDEKCGVSNDIIVTASPEEDCIPAGPKKMFFKDVYYSRYLINVVDFYFCEHFIEHPDTYYADKTYIMSLTQNCAHGFLWGNPDNNFFEYIRYSAPYSTQATPDGKLLPTDIPGVEVEEINDEFYANGHEQYWRNFAKELKDFECTIPVTATDDLNLMMPFYNHDVNTVEGENLSEEDFTEGNHVCMVAAYFAKNNNLKVGDTLHLPLRTANYALPPIYSLGQTPLKANGDNFEVFYKADYTIKGIYRMMPGTTDVGYTLFENEVIIPKKSIKADDSDNIGNYGRYISPYNTTFRIPNGTIDEFMEAWNKKGFDNVSIHFYDRGYSKLEDGIHQMERMALLLLVAGIIMTVLVLVFFCSMMIGGQKRRTAIERSLGASKWDCTKSLLSGLLLVAATGCLVGCIVGTIMTSSVASIMTKHQIFNRAYSAGIVYSEVEEEQEMNGDLLISLYTFIGLIGFTVLVSGVSTWNNLREEPLKLLSSKDNSR